MGAIAVRVTAKLESAETVEDLAGYMDNWFDLLAVRTPKLSRLNAFAGVARVIRLAAEKAKWGNPLPKGHFHGLAAHKSFNSYVAEVCEVSTDSEGIVKIEKVTAAVDCGIPVNPDVVKAQIEGGIGYGIGR